MTPGDGIFALALAGMTTAVAWATVRLAAIRAEALRRLGDDRTMAVATRRARGPA